MDFQRMALVRLREAEVLLAARQDSGAYYLAGYAVECALKACIAKRVKRHDFPDRRLALDAYTHDIEQLVRVADLTLALETEQAADATFRSHWIKVVEWSEGARYERWSLDEAKGSLAFMLTPPSAYPPA